MQELKTIFTSDATALNSTIGKTQGALSGLASKIGGMFAIGAVASFANRLIEAQSAVRHMADALGISTRLLQGLRELGKDIGVNWGQIETALNKIEAARMEALREKTSQSAKAFAALGLNAERLAGMTLEQTLKAMAESFVASNRGAAELGGLIEILGNRNMALIPLLEQLGTEGEAAFNKLAAAGRIASDKTISDMEKLGTKMGAIGTTIGNVMSKAISFLIDGIEKFAALWGGIVGGGGVKGVLLGGLTPGSLKGVRAVIEARESEPQVAAQKRAAAQAAVIESQKRLASQPDPFQSKLIAQNATAALRSSSLTDSLLRMGGGVGLGRDTGAEQVAALRNIENGINRLVAKDTAPRLR